MTTGAPCVPTDRPQRRLLKPPAGDGDWADTLPIRAEVPEADSNLRRWGRDRQHLREEGCGLNGYRLWWVFCLNPLIDVPQSPSKIMVLFFRAGRRARVRSAQPLSTRILQTSSSSERNTDKLFKGTASMAKK